MERILGRKTLILFVSAIFALAFGSSAGAISSSSLTWTDGYITYGLEIIDSETATFTITVDESAGELENYRVGWVAFKFSPAGGEIEDVTGPSGWEEADELDDGLPWGGEGNQKDIDPFKGKWTGFYSEDILTDVAGGGLPLTDSPSYSWTISTDGDFDFLTDLGDDVPFKVGFYDLETGKPHSGKIKTDQLSETLSVPEPATVLLVGVGLIMLGVLRRKFRRS